MTELQRQIVALNLYARNQTYLNEGWATRDFHRTFAAAMAACKDVLEYSTHVEISWSAAAPQSLRVQQSHPFSSSMNFYRELDLQGSVGEAFLAELQALAVVKARQVILEERERALLQEASDRIAGLMHSAKATEVSPA